MTTIIGVLGAALLFGAFAMLRPRKAGCTGHCIGCAGGGACENEGASDDQHAD